MTSVSDDVALTMDDMPLGEDGLIDFRALAVNLIETVADHAMELEADELLGEGNRRNGYRERRLRTVIGEIVLRVPKLREDTYFPERVCARTRVWTGRWWAWSPGRMSTG